jgi:hypothetical protein
MALTKAREIALFQILEVPYSPTTQQMSQDGTMSVQKVVPTAIACYYTITTFLTDHIYTDLTLQTVLEDLLDKWICLGTRVDSLDNGTIGALSGISYSAQKERTEIQRQTIIIVPYYKLADQYKHAADGNIPIIR